MFVVVIGMKLPVLHVPYFWDEMGAYVEPSHWLSQESLAAALPGLHPPTMFFGHPPLLYMLVALVFKQFGTASPGPHLLASGFAFLGVWFTYRLGALLYGRLVGMAAAALLFAMPLYFAQAGMLLGDIPVAALGVMTVYFCLARRYPAFLLAGFCLVMVKETGMAVIAAAVVFQFLADRRGKAAPRSALLLAVPLAPLALFFAAQKLATGSFLPNPYFSGNAFATFTPMSLLLKGGFAVWSIFIAQFRFVPTLAIIAGLFVRRREVWRRELLLFGLIAVFFAGAFTAIYFIPRYSLPVLPYLAITAAASIFALCRSARVGWGATAVCALLFMLAMHGNRKGYNSFETNMEYLDVVWAYQQAGEYLERNYPDTPVYAPWPLGVAYGAPYLGYISKPLAMAPSPEKAGVAVFTEQSELSRQRFLDEYIRRNSLRPLRVFERHGKSTSVFLLPRAPREKP
jgi:4-amino-4-deoxy-L-arabinose transferase-like glycosyltransferase